MTDRAVGSGQLKSDAAVSVSDLTLDYASESGVAHVLRGLSFDIGRGEKVAICGPSGSGKSTLLYILGGLLRPTTGEVLVIQNRIWSLAESERSRFRAERVGFIFQQFHLIPGWTVLQNVLLGAEYSKRGGLEARARELIVRLGLEGLEDRTPNQLSGGQAQRVAIARALLLNPDILFADEPTGALDTATAKEIIGVFDEIHREGKTVIIITHDERIAGSCDRVIRIEDGRLQSSRFVEREEVNFQNTAVDPDKDRVHDLASAVHSVRSFVAQYSLRKSLRLLARNRMRSLLTLFGIAVGVAAVVAMISIGRFAKAQILDSYSKLGVRNFRVWGYPNWKLGLSVPIETFYREFKREDLESVLRLFPQIERYSPVVRFWSDEVSFGGVTTKEVDLMGLNENGIYLRDYEIERGRGISTVDVEERNAVCVLGSQLVSELNMKVDFSSPTELKPLVFVKLSGFSFACRVIGVLAPKKSTESSGREKPGKEVFAPYTFLRAVRGESPNSNQGDLNQVLFEVRDGVVPDDVTDLVKGYFVRKFGPAGDFRAEANSKLIVQMRRFLDVFNVLLAAIAFVTLLVGGTGVTNMIMASLSERVRELGIRRAVGAEPRHLRHLVLSESLTLCVLAGGFGLVSALLLLHAVLYVTSLMFPKIPFTWLFDPFGIGLSLISILVVGIGSGLYPALKVEKQDVVSALRAE